MLNLNQITCGKLNNFITIIWQLNDNFNPYCNKIPKIALY